MKCETCGHGDYVRLTGGNWDAEPPLEYYECELCGATATFRLDGNGGTMIGDITTSYGQ